MDNRLPTIRKMHTHLYVRIYAGRSGFSVTIFSNAASIVSIQHIRKVKASVKQSTMYKTKGFIVHFHKSQCGNITSTLLDKGKSRQCAPLTLLIQLITLYLGTHDMPPLLTFTCV
ncbi:T. brucei spp.-specific protein [Trypanosoma brucei gambiense DAL972]|uniref:T. brucei spp.-specific protein n=2 Tax=Trypanosoma brucei TaxID=5691 RepID=C9ZZX6_TRYB9|nr:T. brucei spp.-specific protein [Trypanosoma brucei gambiense DAL972]RHW68561.1 hypothetical protein DPX39_100141500 [Trypanosoma brucei equiperdum]CBH16534.1 T. brucei spp.-specific protein [Trypanosoma brucei gambiense DAL972]|eukprot:XP_011778798.1 T. brucei spp.-specific protein [Trypanosoma brucei gambiense DAL972]